MTSGKIYNSNVFTSVRNDAETDKIFSGRNSVERAADEKDNM